MRLFRALLLVSMVLGAANWLMADPYPDPRIRLTIPATGTFPLCVADAGGTCTSFLVSGEPDTTIGADGFGSFAVQNVQDPASQLSIDSIIFRFQTDNLFQPFSAFTNEYTNAELTRNFNEGCIVVGSE